MTGDDQASPGGSQDDANSREGKGPANDGPKKAPISFGGTPASADAWNVVPTSTAPSANPHAQPLKMPPAKKADKAPLSPTTPPPAQSSPEPSPSQPSAPEPPSAKQAPQPVEESKQPTKPEPAARKPAKEKPKSKKAAPQEQPSAEKTVKPPPSPPPKREKKPATTKSQAEKPKPAQPNEKPSTTSAAQQVEPPKQNPPKRPSAAPDSSDIPPKTKRRHPDIPIVEKQDPPPSLVDAEKEEEALVEKVRGIAIHQTPAWLVSLIIHFAAVILLALFTVVSYQNEPMTVEATYSEQLGEQLEFEIMVLDTQEFEIDANSGALESLTNSQELPIPRSLTQIDLIGTEAARLEEQETPGVDLQARGEGATRRAMLKAYGGNATTEQAVAAALEWLKRNQMKDGSWSLKGDYTDGSGVENTISATAMALLAFQGAGHTDRSGTHAKTVAKGWNYLLRQLDADGSFIERAAIPNQHRPYTQAQATIALCELYAMTGDEELRPKAQAAIDFAIEWQAPEGGWRYQPQVESDLSVTGWFLMALQSARMGNLDVPDKVFANVDGFLETVATKPESEQSFAVGSRYQYRDSRAEKATPTMTAEGLLCRQYLGWNQNDPRLVAGMGYLLDNPINWNEPNVYYWYYATQVAHHMEGDAWRNWNKDMRQIIPENQVQGGREKGSWSPARDDNGVKAGRLFMTCLCTYMLEVYYRHLPLYSKHQLIGG
ncbi:hypothetical protein AB1L30_23255 [Bremerella sp. JC817]|uniref:prenyltransferase/squalene oxidase repeat-containing protein n=1 Tax=Bremerella sp. JC817 TaxID=3231756 RepID=UPI0034599FCA